MHALFLYIWWVKYHKIMRNHVYFILIALFIFSCSDSETENNIQDLTVSEHIELIKNHDNKIEINFEELPEVSQNYINSLENNITTELILHAQDFGYEIKMRRESRNLVSKFAYKSAFAGRYEALD